jgi:hypothetical protein
MRLTGAGVRLEKSGNSPVPDRRACVPRVAAPAPTTHHTGQGYYLRRDEGMSPFALPARRDTFAERKATMARIVRRSNGSARRSMTSSRSPSRSSCCRRRSRGRGNTRTTTSNPTAVRTGRRHWSSYRTSIPAGRQANPAVPRSTHGHSHSPDAGSRARTGRSPARSWPGPEPPRQGIASHISTVRVKPLTAPFTEGS